MCKLSIALVLVSVVVTVCANAVPSTLRDLDEDWEIFKAHHGVRKGKVEADRKKQFANTHAMIVKHNNGGNSFKMEHNRFSDMDPEEKQALLGARLPTGLRSEWQAGVEDRQLPKSLDLRTNKCLQPIKNQGSCGSCWAFAAIDPLEFSKCNKTGTAIRLSEQQLVSCDTINGGCDGGWYTNAWVWYQRNKGAVTTSAYPYTSGTTGTSGTCTSNSATAVIAAQVASYTNIAATQTAIRTALQKGPVAVAIAVVNSFYSYKSGVYSDSTCTSKTVNHAVSLVGYGTLNRVPYWIVRNSWGTGWGSSGYMLMRRGVNMCKVESYAAAVTAV